MNMTLGEGNISELTTWEKLKLAFKTTYYSDDFGTWTMVYYKVYRGRKYIIRSERYH